MKQYAQNACGTVGIFHILCNIFKDRPDLFKEKSAISNFLTESISATSHTRGEIFMKSESVKGIHKKNVTSGQSKVVEKVDSHFIAIIFKSKIIWLSEGQEYTICITQLTFGYII